MSPVLAISHVHRRSPTGVSSSHMSLAVWWGDLVGSPPWRWRGSWQSGGSLVGRSPVYIVSQHPPLLPRIHGGSSPESLARYPRSSSTRKRASLPPLVIQSNQRCNTSYCQRFATPTVFDPITITEAPYGIVVLGVALVLSRVHGSYQRGLPCAAKYGMDSKWPRSGRQAQ